MRSLPDPKGFFHEEAQRIMKTRHQLIAPVSGKTIALGQVPDPIFSEKLTGDGLAILANSAKVVAPCDGEITLFFETKHAFAITTEDGVQILVHVGLDTILLEGVGIKALHKRGDHVKAGTPILELDLEFLKRRRINLISPVLVVNCDKVAELRPHKSGDAVEAGEDCVLEYAV